MYLFLSVFFLLYGSLHSYFYFRLRSAYTLPFNAKLLTIFLLLIFTFAPLFIRILERMELFIPARILAYLGYTWMAFVFMFFSNSLILEIIKFAGLARQINSFLFPAFIAFVMVCYGFFEAKNIKIEKIIITTPKLKAGETIRVAQISDLHLGIMIKDWFLNKVIERVNELKPDILVSTGDLVDGHSNDINYLTDFFHKIEAGYGRFAILGNHEFYVGIKNSLSFLEKSGFRILRNEYVKIKDNFYIAGIDDDTINKNIDERALLKDIDRNSFVLYCKHKPRISKDAKGFFDLQLSGHTHNGQIFPFTLIVMIFFPAKSGLTEIRWGDNISYLYTSRGTGTWGPPIRFLSRPEVTLIEITGKSH